MLFVFAGPGLQLALAPRGGDDGWDGFGRCSCPWEGQYRPTRGEGMRRYNAQWGWRHRTAGSAHPVPGPCRLAGTGKLLPAPQPFGREVPGEMAQAVPCLGGAGLSPATPPRHGTGVGSTSAAAEPRDPRADPRASQTRVSHWHQPAEGIWALPPVRRWQLETPILTGAGGQGQEPSGLRWSPLPYTGRGAGNGFAGSARALFFSL